jgi:hypothetical protein
MVTRSGIMGMRAIHGTHVDMARGISDIVDAFCTPDIGRPPSEKERANCAAEAPVHTDVKLQEKLKQKDIAHARMHAHACMH